MMLGIPGKVSGINGGALGDVISSLPIPQRGSSRREQQTFDAFGIVFGVGKGTFTLADLQQRQDQGKQDSGVAVSLPFSSRVGSDQQRTWCNVRLLQFTMLSEGVVKVDSAPSVYDALFPIISVPSVKENAPPTFCPAVISYRFKHMYSKDSQSQKMNSRVFVLQILSVIRLLELDGADFSVFACSDAVLDLAIASLHDSVLHERLLALADERLK